MAIDKYEQARDRMTLRDEDAEEIEEEDSDLDLSEEFE